MYAVVEYASCVYNVHIACVHAMYSIVLYGHIDIYVYYM